MAGTSMSMADWELGKACVVHGAVFCAACRPTAFPESVALTHGGRVFHATTFCAGLRDALRSAAQRGDAPEGARLVPWERAVGEAYSPCRLCFPDAKATA